MTTLREGYQAVNDSTDDSGEYNSVYGLSPEEGQSIVNAEINRDANRSGVSYEVGPYGSDYSRDPVLSGDQGNAATTYRTDQGTLGINWGSKSPSIGGSSTSDVSWATPYSQVSRSAGASSGLRSTGLTTDRKSIASVQTTKTVFPTGTEYPTFKGPTWDEGEIRKRARKAAAPGMSALESKVTQAMARYYENPNVRRMVLRDTLQGYGIGLSNIRAQADRTAQAEYGQEYARLYSEAMNNFTRELNELQLQATRVTSQQPIYTTKELEAIQGTKQNVDILK